MKPTPVSTPSRKRNTSIEAKESGLSPRNPSKIFAWTIVRAASPTRIVVLPNDRALRDQVLSSQRQAQSKPTAPRYLASLDLEALDGTELEGRLSCNPILGRALGSRAVSGRSRNGGSKLKSAVLAARAAQRDAHDVLRSWQIKGHG